MEFFESACHLSEVNASYPDADQAAYPQQLRQLVSDFHEEGLVHGDLRHPNIIIEGDRVLLLDFDWGGREGEVSYPTARLCKELTEGRSHNGLKITKEDDKRILDATLKGL